MVNEAKIIKNIISSYPQSEVKNITLNCIYTLVAAHNYLAVPKLHGVPPSIYRLLPQGDAIYSMDIARLRTSMDLKCGNELQLIHLDHRNVGTSVLESLLTKADMLLKEMLEHEI